MQALEQLVCEVKKEGKYKTIDIYTNGAIELYTGTLEPPIYQIQATLRDYGIGGGNNFGLGNSIASRPLFEPEPIRHIPEKQTKLSDFGSDYEVKPCYKIVTTHDGEGLKSIYRDSGDSLHLFSDGKAHLDIGTKRYGIERMGDNPLTKGIGGYW